jgi:hypothetical protein
MPRDEDDTERSEKVSPEEDTLRDLVNLAVTIRDDGQVNPLMVVDISQGVTRLYRIETGERRYWATWLLRDFISGYNSDGMIDCIVIPVERASAFRQAKENTARKGLTSIAMARQAALLLLTVHGYEIPSHAVTNDFYRQALDLNLRGKREYTAAILSSMGGINRARFSQYKALLQLADDALELADRYGIDEFRLCPVLQLPVEAQAEMIQQIVQFNLSGRQISEICEKGSDDNIDEGVDTTLPHIRRFVKSMKRMNEQDEADFRRQLLEVEQSPTIAIARIDSTIAFLMRVKSSIYS